MKQYCRYCANLFTGNGTWCEAKKKEIADSTAKTENHCELFQFCEIDAFDITKKYKAREKKVYLENQPSLIVILLRKIKNKKCKFLLYMQVIL